MARPPEDFLAVLNARSQDIFRKIVERYLDTGSPVGSRDLSRMLQTGLSPASVRNVMADLEDLGLIAAPHTSAGRAPTQEGLRFFVDAMLEVGAVNETGLQDFNLEEAQVARAMLHQARMVTVLADDSKFEQHALFPVAPLEKINRLVSNMAPGAELSASLREAGVEMIVAEVSGD